MVERQLPKLDTRVRFPSPAYLSINELAKFGVPAIVFDYGQGFSTAQLPSDFARAVNVVELAASSARLHRRQSLQLHPLPN
jgi:hypothetical protein